MKRPRKSAPTAPLPPTHRAILGNPGPLVRVKATQRIAGPELNLEAGATATITAAQATRFAPFLTRL